MPGGASIVVFMGVVGSSRLMAAATFGTPTTASHPTKPNVVKSRPAAVAPGKNEPGRGEAKLTVAAHLRGVDATKRPMELAEEEEEEEEDDDVVVVVEVEEVKFGVVPT